jgi:hypothetical protein
MAPKTGEAAPDGTTTISGAVVTQANRAIG